MGLRLGCGDIRHLDTVFYTGTESKKDICLWVLQPLKAGAVSESIYCLGDGYS